MDQWLKEIEKYKEDSNKYYQTTCKVNLRKPKKLLKIYDDNFNLKKKVTPKKDQVTIISERIERQ